MKGDERDKKTGTESSEEPMEELKKFDRGEFLKTVGVGVAAAGLGLVTGKPSALAATEPDTSSRSGIQKLMRSLLENPARAKDFLESPQTVAEELGVRLTEADAGKIKEAFTKLAMEAGSGLHETHTEYTDSGHHNSVTSPLQRKPGTAKPPKGVIQKPPTGGTRHK